MTLIYIIYDMQQHACWCFFGFADDNPNLHVSLTTGVKTQYLTNDAEFVTELALTCWVELCMFPDCHDMQHACWCGVGVADDMPDLLVSLTTGVKTQYLTNDAELGTTKDSIQVVANSFLEILVVKMQQIGIH